MQVVFIKNHPDAYTFTTITRNGETEQKLQAILADLKPGTVYLT